MDSLLRNRLLTTLLSISGLLAGLAISEVCLRSFGKDYDTRFLTINTINTPEEKDVIKNWRVENWAQECMRGSRRLGYEPIPNMCGRNSLGLIGDEIKTKKEEDEIRILVVGDSVTEQGYYVNYLRQMLRKRNENIQVLNAGVTGYNTRQEVVYIIERGILLEPSVIIISFVLNDFQFTPVVFRHDGRLCYFGRTGLEVFDKIDPTLFEYSNLYRFLVWRLGMLTRQDHGQEEVRRTRVEYPLRDLKRLLSKRGIPLIIIVFAYPVDFICFTEREMEAYRDILTIADKYNIKFLDLMPHFSDKDTLCSIQEKVDGLSTGHPNKEGHLIAADAIYAYLMSEVEIRGILFP